MTAGKTTAKPDSIAAGQPDTAEPAAPETPAAPTSVCGAEHVLPMLSHITCQLAAQPDLELGDPGHEHRHQAGEALYVWR